MRNTVVVSSILLGLAAVLFAQQNHPNIPAPQVVLENDRVAVQKVHLTPGRWTGEHSHKESHLAVALDDVRMVFKEGDKEREVSLKKGDVFWSDSIASHAHAPLDSGTVLLITLKD